MEVRGIRYAQKTWRTPGIQQKAEQTAQRAMTEGFVKQVQQLAKQDAQRGVYMGSAYRQLQQQQMKQFVSPDRSRPMAQMTALLQQAARQREPMLELLDNLLGHCSGKLHSSPQGQTAQIYAPNGEIIASYNSLGSGWTISQTKAESKFQSAAAVAYLQAFRQARAEINAAQAPSQGVDLRA